MVLPVPTQSSALTTKDGTPSTHAYRWMDSVGEGINSLTTSNAGKASKTQTWSQSWLIEFPDAKDYRVEVNAALARTITSVTTKSRTGTCTLTPKINTTALGGGANSVSTTEQTKTHSSANSIAVGDDLVLTVSAVSSCENVSITVSGTITLA